jgi:hypothetical protein
VSSARSGESLSRASWTVTGCGRASARSATSWASAPPRAVMRSYWRPRTQDWRVRSAASAEIVPLSSWTPSIGTVRRRAARSSVPATRRSTSGSERGVRSVRERSTGSSPITACRVSSATTVRSRSPPGFEARRSSARSRAGRGRSGYRKRPSRTVASSSNPGNAPPPQRPWTRPDRAIVPAVCTDVNAFVYRPGTRERRPRMSLPGARKARSTVRSSAAALTDPERSSARSPSRSWLFSIVNRLWARSAPISAVRSRRLRLRYGSPPKLAETAAARVSVRRVTESRERSPLRLSSSPSSETSSRAALSRNVMSPPWISRLRRPRRTPRPPLPAGAGFGPASPLFLAMSQLAAPSRVRTRRSVGSSTTTERTTTGAPWRHAPHRLPRSSTTSRPPTEASVSPSNGPTPVTTRPRTLRSGFGKWRRSESPALPHSTRAETASFTARRARSSIFPRKRRGTRASRTTTTARPAATPIVTFLEVVRSTMAAPVQEAVDGRWVEGSPLGRPGAARRPGPAARRIGPGSSIYRATEPGAVGRATPGAEAGPPVPAPAPARVSHS